MSASRNLQHIRNAEARLFLCGTLIQTSCCCPRIIGALLLPLATNKRGYRRLADLSGMESAFPRAKEMVFQFPFSVGVIP